MATESEKKSSLTEKTLLAARNSLRGNTKGILGFLPFIGPAVIASIAYEDPGNFATNIQGGSEFGYMLLWVIVLANIIAMLFQSLSAKLGIVTGKSLATLSREHFPRPLVYFMWIGSEIAAIATDLAEFLGASIGLSLLFHLPLLVSFVIVGVATYSFLLLQGFGFRPMEILIGAFVSIISVSYLAEIVLSKPQWSSIAYHSVVPQLAGSNSVLLAVGIVGATVMPHAIYLHSSLTRDRIPTDTDADRKKVLWFSNIEVVVALGVAGLVNMAMLAMAAAVFFATGHKDIADINTAYQTLTPLLGGAAASIFLTSLLASGFSSSIVGTMAGQGIMQDFVGFRIPLWARRLITMVPPFFVILAGINGTTALVVSQVVLSLALPIPIIALGVLTARRDVMGTFVSGIKTNTAMIICCVVVLFLNTVLLLQMAGVPIPFVG
jgi:manganese transport protein